MSELWDPGYYNVETLVSGEFTEIKDKDCCKLNFKMAEADGAVKTVFLYFTGGAAEISYKTLGQLGWNGDHEKPEFSAPTAIEKLKLEHYQGKESWKTAAGSKPIDKDRGRRLASEYKAYTKQTPKPSGKPSTPPPAGKKPGPPPAKPKDDDKQDPKLKASNKEEAWDVWRSFSSDGDNVNTDLWQKAIDAVGPDEGKFGGAEWQKVANKAIPI